MADPWTILAAAAIEGVVGNPDRLHARALHPVAWLGAASTGPDQSLAVDRALDEIAAMLECSFNMPALAAIAGLEAAA